MLSPRISVILPVLDEAARIVDQLRHLRTLTDLDEVIVVDGGSTDATVVQVRQTPQVRLLTTAPGRGLQMNAGAAVATGDVLLFLHADVRLPQDAVAHVWAALEDPLVVAGAFRTWTIPDGEGWPLGPLLHLADIRSRISRLPYGDQAIFIRQEVFRDLGGFAEIPLMEDLEISRRLRGAGRIARVSARVTVSGRRFQARPLTYTLMVNLYPLLYRLGVPPRWLVRFYGRVR